LYPPLYNANSAPDPGRSASGVDEKKKIASFLVHPLVGRNNPCYFSSQHSYSLDESVIIVNIIIRVNVSLYRLLKTNNNADNTTVWLLSLENHLKFLHVAISHCFPLRNVFNHCLHGPTTVVAVARRDRIP